MAQQASAYPAPGRNRWDGSDRIRLRGRELPLKWEAARLRRPAVRIESERIVVLAPAADVQTPKLDAALRQALLPPARVDARAPLAPAAWPPGGKYRDPRTHHTRTH